MSKNYNKVFIKQCTQANWFCVSCNNLVTNSNHKCINEEVYAIPSSAEIPRKCRSKRKWKVFKEQFVFIEPIGYWIYYEYSWWYKNKGK